MKNPIDVLMLAVNDWANTGYRFSRCLRMLGLKTMYYKGYEHPFQYPEQGLIHPALQAETKNKDGSMMTALVHNMKGMGDIVNASRAIHYIASIFCNPQDVDISKKIIVAQHGGRTYRENSDFLNNVYNPIVSDTIIQNPDLLGKGCTNERWILYPVDTDMIKPVYHNRSYLVIGHHPTAQDTKGSLEIMKALYDFSKIKKYQGLWFFSGDVKQDDSHRSVWYTQLDQIAQCDIYIEACQLTYHGYPYGAWGNAAIEAAALGKIVITHSLYEDAYKKEYGDHPMLICNSGEQIKEALEKLLTMDLTDVRKLQRAHREWAVQKHGMKVTAKRIWDKVYQKHFPEKEQLVKDALTYHESPKETICDTLRGVYKLVQSPDGGAWKAQVEEQLLKAMGMAKSMNDKLTDYQHDWDREIFKEKTT